MMPVILFTATFVAVAVAATNGAIPDVHVQDVYPSLAFFAGVIVAVLGFLLKFFMTRDRASIDRQIMDNRAETTTQAVELRREMLREVDLLHKHLAEIEMKTKGFIDGLGIKVERIADTVDEKVGEAVEELRRHDEDIYTQLRTFNRELGVLQGEHDVIRSRGEGKNHHNRDCTEGKI